MSGERGEIRVRGSPGIPSMAFGGLTKPSLSRDWGRTLCPACSIRSTVSITIQL